MLYARWIFTFLDTQVSLASTPVSLSVHMLVGHPFRFPFCQRPWELTKPRDDIVVADMAADMAADMEVHMVTPLVADMEVDKVADMVADEKHKGACKKEMQ